jgi:hypothetical protein
MIRAFKNSLARKRRKTRHHRQSKVGLKSVEIRPYRNGWQCFEAPGAQAY